MASIQRRQQIGLDHMGAARQIDEAGTDFHVRQPRGIKKTARFWRQRQQVDDGVG